jgi:hypothetical protein
VLTGLSDGSIYGSRLDGRARKLAIQLFWMMRKGWDYEQVKRFGPHAGQPENRRGVQ